MSNRYHFVGLLIYTLLLAGCQSEQTKLIEHCEESYAPSVVFTGLVPLPVYSQRSRSYCHADSGTTKIAQAIRKSLGDERGEYRVLLDNLKKVCSGNVTIDEDVPEAYCEIFK